MTRQDIMEHTCAFIEQAPENYVEASAAITPELAGLRMFDEPIFAFGAVDDPLFHKLRQPQAVGSLFQPPETWLSGARTVVSFFLPFTQEVRESNRREFREPSAGWLHARIEGQDFLNMVCLELQNFLRAAEYESVIPSLDPRFSIQNDGNHWYSSWSERHVAFVCGLGTFGLSAGLITERGMAGRLGSLITSLALPPDVRPYTDIYEYCIQCGACQRRCPAQAITSKGKSHPLCDALLDEFRDRYKPRYGCGKCQVGVPCESRRPPKNVGGKT